MSMDAETIEGVRASMTYRIVENRRRDLAETIALRLLRENGTVSADDVASALAAEWVEPNADEVLDIVTRKAQAAVEYHQGEIADADRDLAVWQGKVDKAAAELEAAQSSLAQAQSSDRAAEAESRKADAEAILASAEQAGGSAGRAPGGQNAAAAAEVAGIVGEVINPGNGG